MKTKNLIYRKPNLINNNSTHYCPGCSHGVIHKLVAEVIEKMNLVELTIGVGSVGCSVFIHNYINIDWLSSAHGRATASATAIKRLNPNKMVFTYQGDGDLAAIGTAETIHSCNRGENIVILFINNAIYGMTGGQMSPTTPLKMTTATCPYGRNELLNGYPLKITDLLIQLDGTCLVSREAVFSIEVIKKAKKSLYKAFENSINNRGTSVIEFISNCVSGWKMSPVKANQWIKEVLLPIYPLGILKNK